MLDLSKYPRFLRDPKLVKRLAFLEIEWRQMCPYVELQDQLGWASYWLSTNGKKYTDMTRFLSNWFKRNQKDLEAAKAGGGPIRYGANKFVEEKPKEEDVLGPDDFKKMREEIVRNKLKGVA